MKIIMLSFVMYNYCDMTNTDAITTKEKITANLQDLCQYFVGAQLKSTAGDMWAHIQSGFNDSASEMKDAKDCWFRENNRLFSNNPSRSWTHCETFGCSYLLIKLTPIAQTRQFKNSNKNLSSKCFLCAHILCHTRREKI